MEPGRPSKAPHGEDAGGNKPKLMKPSSGRRGGRSGRAHNKVRVHLPPIESYEKELEFPAEGPGRVVVRLERLMGTDRVRLTDTKYMSTLLERLEEQEREAWTERRLGRIKAERNRYRKLAIDGLMEPGADMQDLYAHPVFRVNRVLNKLSKMDHNITLTPMDNLPPIVEIDPFMDDNSGGAFKYYPGHALDYEVNSEMGDERRSTHHRGRTPRGTSRATVTTSNAATTTASKASTVRIDAPKGSDALKPHRRPTKHSRVTHSRVTHTMEATPSNVKEQNEDSRGTLSKGTLVRGTLLRGTLSRGTLAKPSSHSVMLTAKTNIMDFPDIAEMEQRYGVPPETDVLKWEPFRSHLVDTVFHEDGQGVLDLYAMAEDVLGVYSREIETSDDFGIKLGRLMRG